jgi:WS/DGAT/MGAT family acyltransferase
MTGIYDPSTAPNGRPSFEQILDKLRACLPGTTSLRRKLVRVPLDIDRPYWVEDPDFDLEFHVRHLALPKPGDWQQFRTQVARLHARPLDLTRPPWEMTVIDGIDAIPGYPEGSFATVLKVHHAAIDGVSGVELLNLLHDFTPDAEQVEVPDMWHAEPVPTGRDLLRRAGVNAVSNPLQAVRMLSANASPLVKEMANSVRGVRRPARIPRTRFNGRVSAHRVWDEARCSLVDLKRVKNLVPGASINDACLSIIGGAMRSYLLDLNELPDESLVTIVPVSTRTPDQATAGGNQVSGMRVKLNTQLADPVERLAAIRDETQTKKAAQDGLAMPVLLEIAQLVPGALIGAAVRGISSIGDRGPVMANTIVTNVPGSQVPLYLLGCRLALSTGCVPLVDGIGLFHCVTSFCGDFTFMFTADRDMLPDPTDYLRHLQQSIADHIAAAADAVDPPAAHESAATRSPVKPAKASKSAAKSAGKSAAKSAAKSARKSASKARKAAAGR